MRVNISVGSGDIGWIGGRLARELAARLPAYGVEATINGPAADLHYEQIVYGDPPRRPAVGMFTHGDFRPRRYAREYDGHICLNSVMRDFLLEGGAPDPVVIALPVDDRYRPNGPLVFGVVGRTYSDGRKGEALVAQMVEAGYVVRAWGSGWPCQIVSSDLADLPAFYRGINYLCDTSHDEGGVVSAIEAMAMGVPVISHTVGVDRPVIPYERSNWESLSRVLKALTTPRTYDSWAADHAVVFRDVMSRIGAIHG